MITVFHFVSNKYWGGPEESAYEMVSRLRHDKRFYAEVVCKKNEPVLLHFRRLEIPISILPLKGKTDMDSPKRLARLIRKGHNVLHVHTFNDAFTAMLARYMSDNPHTRIIMTLHGIVKPRTNYFHRKIYHAIDKMVFVSQKAHDVWMAGARGFDPQKALVIRDSVIGNPLASPAPNLRQQLNVGREKALILYHGRLCPEKGIDVLLKAATQLDKDSYHLAIIGEGSPKYVTQIKAFIVANQLVRNVSLLGFQEDIAHLIEQCDMGVLPSVEPEALGIANLEYMMQGRPHITTNNGAQPEYVTDGLTAMLIEPGNPFSLAAAMQSLIADPAMRQRMGQQAQDEFEAKLNYDIHYQQMTDLYHDVFASRPQ
ncbi:MAG: glycosyltransferase family 4 protein [Muribaculaceae bacterium]|nr:glycosyltransferase family 4 protein [Muribaculaceae bacterium]